MFRRLRPLGSRLKWPMLILLVLANVLWMVSAASAHKWMHSSGDCGFHYHESSLEVYRYDSRLTEKEAALDDWAVNTDLSFNNKSSHGSGDDGDGNVDFTMLYSYEGDTGWGGLAVLEDKDLDYDHCGSWPNYAEVDHGHAWMNPSEYGTDPDDIQGIFCQEVGHLFGLTHSDHGCMGKSYTWSGVRNEDNTTESHNWSDINAIY